MATKLDLEIYILARFTDDLIHCMSIEELEAVAKRIRELQLKEDTVLVLRSIYSRREEHLKDYHKDKD